MIRKIGRNRAAERRSVIAGLAVVAAISLLVGCTRLDRRLERGRKADTAKRTDVLEYLEDWVDRGRHRRDPQARAQVDAFLLERIGVEPNAYLRTRLVFVALQGDFPAAPEILLLAARDRERHVRLAAVKGMRQQRIPEAREILTDLLLNDLDLIVRVEVTKTMATIGTEDWAVPLVEVLLDPTEDYNLRAQAYFAANELARVDLPFLVEEWKKWLEERRG